MSEHVWPDQSRAANAGDASNDPTAPEPADQTRADVVLGERVSLSEVSTILALLPMDDQGTGHVADCGWDDSADAPKCGCYDLPRRIRAAVERILADRLAAERAEHAAEVERWKEAVAAVHPQSAVIASMWMDAERRAEAAEATVAGVRGDVEAAGRHLARVLTDERVRRQGSDRIFLAVHDAQNALARVRAALDGERR